ncbi:MAG: HAMP domain-containing histidine kinase [Lewinellaceae bacterium]|nr:HAMP domain-containing histidine kinase [Lewinellaceae bacterium]
MRDIQIMRVVILGMIAITGIIAMQSYWVLSTWNINEQEFNRKAHLALYRVAEALADANGTALPARDVVKKRSSNYFVVNIADEIDTELLEYYLQRELENLVLNIDFEYAVFDCNTNEMVYGNYCSYDPERKAIPRSSQLPGYHEFTYYFGVKFPTRSGFLWGRMQLSLFFSGILLLTVVFFTYSLGVILRQKRLSEAQKDFINNMTHEFKTPLSTIKIAAEVFLKSPAIIADARLHQYADIIQEQNARLNQQVERVLRLAQLEREEFNLQQEPFNLASLIQPIAQSEAMRIEESGGKLNTDLAAADVTVMADKIHLTNILHSLLDNARKYCLQNPIIHLRCHRTKTGLQLEIEDNGVGIPRELQTRVFEKFFRVPTGNIHNVKGFGLGLYYVNKVCQAHGWRLKLESKEGSGTLICIQMPIKQE